MDKKPKKKLLSNWGRIAVEGATCDKRTIERQWIEQMADTYSPKVYGARINLEHLKGILPDGPFQRYGDVAMVKKEEIAEDGPLKGKLALLARLAPTDSLVEMNRKGQKVYTSVEVNPKFADTGKAYLVGLAVTDDPASLGTEMLSFCASAQSNPLAARKRSPENIFSVAEEIELEFEEVEESSGDGDIILPSRTALELRRLLGEEGMTELEISERHIRVRFSDTLLYSKLIEGTYPNFRQIIPGSFQKTLDIPRDAVMQTLDLLAVPLTADISNLKLTFKRGELEFFSRNDTVGEGKDRLEVAYDYDDPLEITFNYQLLQAPFRYVREDQFRLQMNGANSPIMIEDGKGFHYILMPLRVK